MVKYSIQFELIHLASLHIIPFKQVFHIQLADYVIVIGYTVRNPRISI